MNRDNSSTNNRIKQAQAGNSEIREDLISEHQAFVRQITARHALGHSDITSQDEYSIGLIALNEAIDSYRPGLRSFQSFAASVIKKRLIDYYRSQKKHRSHAGLDDIPEPAASRDLEDLSDRIDLKAEMQAFVTQLREFGITMSDLVEESPKHRDSRLLCIHIARTLVGEAELKSHLLKYHTIPLTMLLKKLNINVKTVERNRKFIISLCLILLSDLESMKGYIDQFSQGGDENVI